MGLVSSYELRRPICLTMTSHFKKSGTMTTAFTRIPAVALTGAVYSCGYPHSNCYIRCVLVVPLLLRRVPTMKYEEPIAKTLVVLAVTLFWVFALVSIVGVIMFFSHR